MDGTLVDSTTGVKGAWNLFQETYPTVDVDSILSCEHLYLQYSAMLFLDFIPMQLAMAFAPSRLSEVIVASKIQRFSK